MGNMLEKKNIFYPLQDYLNIYIYVYTLWLFNVANWRITMLLIGKSSKNIDISMAYVT